MCLTVDPSICWKKTYWSFSPEASLCEYCCSLTSQPAPRVGQGHFSSMQKCEWKLHFSEGSVLQFYFPYSLHFPLILFVWLFDFFSCGWHCLVLNSQNQSSLPTVLWKTKHNLKNAWNVQHSLPAIHLPIQHLPESEKLTSSAWKSPTSYMIECGPLYCSPTVCCRVGGAVSLVWCLNPQGLDKDTWLVWCWVYLYLYACVLQLWKTYKAVIQSSLYGTQCWVTYPLLASVSTRRCLTKLEAENFSIVNTSG